MLGSTLVSGLQPLVVFPPFVAHFPYTDCKQAEVLAVFHTRLFLFHCHFHSSRHRNPDKLVHVDQNSVHSPTSTAETQHLTFDNMEKQNQASTDKVVTYRSKHFRCVCTLPRHPLNNQLPLYRCLVHVEHCDVSRAPMWPAILQWLLAKKIMTQIDHCNQLSYHNIYESGHGGQQ